MYVVLDAGAYGDGQERMFNAPFIDCMLAMGCIQHALRHHSREYPGQGFAWMNRVLSPIALSTQR